MVSANSVPVLSTSIAVMTAAVGMGLILFQKTIDYLPNWVTTLIVLVAIPLTGYILSVLGSSIYQFGKCKKLDMKGILVSNTIVLGVLTVASSILAFEQVPILKYIFGAFPPRDPTTGEPYGQDTESYIKGMENENHYKLQWFSNIVKAALPMYVSESVKDGFSYAYWIFFLTLLPSYFMMSLQGSC
jgi:hypothetical protein